MQLVLCELGATSLPPGAFALYSQILDTQKSKLSGLVVA
jgi:hypothetical protein